MHVPESLASLAKETITRRKLLSQSLGLVAASLLPTALNFSGDSALADNSFAWACGIEDTFIPQTRPGFRALDEYELTQHYEHWRNDLDLAASLGISRLRWGIPWYKVEREPGRFDWSWVDGVINYMTHELHLQPILDLVHYGTPNWLPKSFLDPSYPKAVERYAIEVVRRYGASVNFFTPNNEPMVAADLCFKRGIWPPYGRTEDAYVQGIVNISRGIQSTVTAIRRYKSNATMISVEFLGRYQAATNALEHEADLAFERDLLPFDLARGAVTKDHPLHGWILSHGVTERELEEIVENAVVQDVLGVNFYPWSVKTVQYDATNHLAFTTARAADGSLLKEVLTKAYNHARKPLFVTETSAPGDVNERKRWMDATIEAVKMARRDRIPVIGYTWFPMFSMINWEYRINSKPADQNLLHLGLWDATFDSNGTLVRHSTALVDEYKQAIASFKG